MSASLVGSEMCIRDSPMAQGALGPQPPQSLVPPDPAPPAAEPLELVMPCLLYTSDAADDM
eukprot:2302961-Alexandrium_andersonii.AAC.1